MQIFLQAKNFRTDETLSNIAICNH